MKARQILQNIAQAWHITQLTPLQERLLSLSTTPDNILVTAPTGSGKTLGFTLNVLAAMGPANGRVQTVVIVPSRELAMQVGEVMRRCAVGSYKTTICYGGHPFVEEQRSLSAGTDIIVTTPGRLLDHINRQTVDLSTASYLILDEYDKSLELGFADEMKRIVRRLPHLRRTVMTSATRIPSWPDWLPARPTLDLNATNDQRARAQSPRERGENVQREACCRPSGPAAPAQSPRERGENVPSNALFYSAEAGAEVQPGGEPEGEAGPAAPVERVKVTSYQRDKLQTLNDLLRAIGADTHSTIIFVNHRESAERVHAFLRRLGYAAGLYHGGLDQLARENALEMLSNSSTPILVSTDLGARGLDITGIDNVIHYHLPSSPESWTHRNGRTGRMGAPGHVYAIVSDDEVEPAYVTTSRTWTPPAAPASAPAPAAMATLWVGAGKKEKISRGDILGFLTQAAGIPSEAIGRIALRDHSALVAVGAAEAPKALAVPAPKIKGKRVRVLPLK